MQKTISMMVGKGSISHNNRKFTAKNVVAERTSENKIYVQDDLREVYHELFDTALERYNAKQKRPDRKIDDYYEKIRQGRQEKLFHELIVQVGNWEDSGYGKRDSFEAVWCLEDYNVNFVDIGGISREEPESEGVQCGTPHGRGDTASPH